MSQLFRPRATTIGRSLLIGVPIALLGGVGVNAAWQSSAYRSGVDLAIEQPVPFSHRHHVGGLGIECRYCHGGVEREAYAGMPSSETCLSCHSQIWAGADLLEPVRRSVETGKPLRWRRVYRLPDYVYFDHSAHVQNGVACMTCHGNVETMPQLRKARTFTMRDCLDCHRRVEATRKGPSFLTRCNTCHR